MSLLSLSCITKISESTDPFSHAFLPHLFPRISAKNLRQSDELH
ncbi:hypothetical protein HMPREF1985_01266 [Mitsuokella sp. oral taxon 131 str. W9106]|nr:hypothetical protein HMPREF1985_01266 [Mitsuokella sp. oral taxon 131 str. W9106]